MNTEKLDPNTQFLAVWRDKNGRLTVKKMWLEDALESLDYRYRSHSDSEILAELGYPESVMEGLPPAPSEDDFYSDDPEVVAAAGSMEAVRDDALRELFTNLSRTWEFVQRLWDAESKRDTIQYSILLAPDPGTPEVREFWDDCEQLKRQYRLDINPALEVDLGDQVALVEAWISDPDEHTDQTHIIVMSQANPGLGVDALPVEDFDWDEDREYGTFTFNGQERFTLDVGDIADDVLREQGWVRVDGWDPASYSEPGTYEAQTAIAVKIA